MLLFQGAPSTSFTPSLPFLMIIGRSVIDMELVASAAGEVDWFLEYSSDDPASPSARWYRETTEDAAGGGTINMLPVTRVTAATGAGIVRSDAQICDQHRYCRVQFKSPANITSLRIDAPFGLAVVA